MVPHSLIAGAAVLLVLSSVSARAIELYSTGFENFAPGPDQLVGTDGWLGNGTGLGVHGIDDSILGPLGNSAFLGGVQPASRFTTVFRTVDYDPVQEAHPIVEFEALIGIQDSSNFRRDDFFITFYNIEGDFLAALNFNNTVASFGLWRLDGVSAIDTGDIFFRNEVMVLAISVNFAANEWSVVLDDIPVFENARFHASSRTLDLGSVAAEWLLSAPAVEAFGDNWMLFDEWSISAFPVELEEAPFFVCNIETDSEMRPVLTWQGEPGFTYQISYSADLVTWLTDLPGSNIDSGITHVPLTYIDDTVPPGRRYYRVIRTPQ